jgi:hypothetical protein
MTIGSEPDSVLTETERRCGVAALELAPLVGGGGKEAVGDVRERAGDVSELDGLDEWEAAASALLRAVKLLTPVVRQNTITVSWRACTAFECGTLKPSLGVAVLRFDLSSTFSIILQR